VVDEAFADADEQASLVSAEDANNVVLLRSTGKFYGLAGMRLGFTICSQTIAEALRSRLGPWSV
jgi:cobalamin biosynthesis protein CobC